MSFEQKSIAASIVLALAVLQLLAISLGRGWVGGLSPKARGLALRWHRGEGYLAFTIMVVVAYYCTRLYPGSGTTRVRLHMLLGATALILVLAKILIMRVYTRFYPRMPILGAVLFADILALWLSGAGWYFFWQ